MHVGANNNIQYMLWKSPFESIDRWSYQKPHTFIFWVSSLNSTSKDVSHIFDDGSKVLCCLVLVQHLVEGVVKLAWDRIDLQLLPDDLVLQLVDPEREGTLWIEGGTIFVLQHIFCTASHYHWYLWCSLLMFISAYSDLESDCFRRMFSCLIWSCTIMILSKFILVSKNCFDQFMLVWR